MTMPIVTGVPFGVVRARADWYVDPGPDGVMPAPVIRELDRRRSGGVDVRLLWSQTDGRVMVAVSDAKTGERLAVPVAPREALSAFHHPFSYAASNDGVRRGVNLGTPGGGK